MTLSFNPRITDKFVKYVLGDNIVQRSIEENFEEDCDKDKIEAFAKQVIIKAMTCYTVDINDIINKLSQAAEHQD